MMIKSSSIAKILRYCSVFRSIQRFESSTTTSFPPESPASPITQQLPLIVSRQIEYPHIRYPPLQAWLETLGQKRDEKLGLVDLHPSIWQTSPRLDILYENIEWQKTYKKIDWAYTPPHHEYPNMRTKPWPQKGTGRARHKSRFGPQWKGGYKVNGPKGPTSFFYVLPKEKRIEGLCTALTVKLHQNDVHIVDSLDLPTHQPTYLQELAEDRFWGPSILFVDDTDIMPHNIMFATAKTEGFTLMPVYGLNVHSMIKHTTLVLTIRALNKIEKKLLHALHSYDTQKDQPAAPDEP
ncbi:unnamed protein product [Rotaria magnacalcarata]|uniref:Large ribosomal subunit protein uL4m n=3 Tax=Rotaria magnacalcarata TaxID=392030 RepID=A0A816N0D4_9BILA|nr:unnamed protein product [Rotaria magnacalcarata]CAF1669209.1 unnamed protein product [Rotaria magnacalcarata]CAF2016659.1 unnamed protein product [Rotaria magnacalcarata]CAF2084008.1 unnamed protein product [Rotaria magnacalcarata]CAF3929209.1 unnamed protein product [Rotaria magnacalcarata]